MDVTDASLTPGIRSYWSNLCGINYLSILHQARFFDICQCMPHDVMHIILKGVVPYEIKLLLRYAIDDLGLFTINRLNENIQRISLSGLEAKDRPSAIDRSHVNSRGHKLNQSAAQVMTLCNIMPYIMESFSHQMTDIGIA